MVGAPVPGRVDADTKAALLGLVGQARDAGWSLEGACQVLQLDPRRVRRWTRRTRHPHGLIDARPGGAVNALTPEEIEAILTGFEDWGGPFPPPVGAPRLLRRPVLGLPIDGPQSPGRRRPALPGPAPAGA